MARPKRNSTAAKKRTIYVSDEYWEQIVEEAESLGFSAGGFVEFMMRQLSQQDQSQPNPYQPNTWPSPYTQPYVQPQLPGIWTQPNQPNQPYYTLWNSTSTSGTSASVPVLPKVVGVKQRGAKMSAAGKKFIMNNAIDAANQSAQSAVDEFWSVPVNTDAKPLTLKDLEEAGKQSLRGMAKRMEENLYETLKDDSTRQFD